MALNAVAGVTAICAGACTVKVTGRAVEPILLVVLVNANEPLCTPTASASAPAVSTMVTVTLPPAGTVPLAGVACAQPGPPVTVKSIGTWPLLVTV